MDANKAEVDRLLPVLSTGTKRPNKIRKTP